MLMVEFFSKVSRVIMMTKGNKTENKDWVNASFAH